MRKVKREGLEDVLQQDECVNRESRRQACGKSGLPSWERVKRPDRDLRGKAGKMHSLTQ